ncbi:Gfo/Idh/MocA family oxidoreductase [Paenibacillus hemerocallicola]|uniref:Gfo/Idh/MocA family oxidoreductase n=1 Tax=Paenibacillus hemerocallicola TaxID=1172614 RepID=A0A5C4TGR2_9BACL|nr:Gfo/Idh/MocA family oxidoreductase [Paenibacillus hemerocallicola]TNJ67846.1 Gfo/Idh/MocA family oxidoreductase [Paenibacillus hemerocallicola]
MEKPYSVAIIGAGQIVKIHLEAIRKTDRSRVTAIADLVESRAREWAAEHGATAYTDYRDMVLKEKPDIVIINLPHFLHRPAAIWCAEQGCHVLLEKPMALNAAECMEIIEAGKRNGVLIAIGHMQQFFAEHVAAKALIQSGELGELVEISDRRCGAYFRESRPEWFLDKERSGGGVVINLGSHSIDRIQWMTGSRIVKVKAKLTHYGQRGNVEGSGSLFMETSEGVPVHATIGGYDNAPENETVLLFTKGTLRIRQRKELLLSKGGAYEPVPVPKLADPFIGQWTALLDAVEHGTELTISGEYGLSVLEVVEAAYRSHETGTEQPVLSTSATNSKIKPQACAWEN